MRQFIAIIIILVLQAIPLKIDIGFVDGAGLVVAYILLIIQDYREIFRD